MKCKGKFEWQVIDIVDVIRGVNDWLKEAKRKSSFVHGRRDRVYSDCISPDIRVVAAELKEISDWNTLTSTTVSDLAFFFFSD